MSSEFGKKIKVTVFGESHGEEIGVLISGMPLGEKIDKDELMRFLDRRRGGKNALSTQRKEADIPIFTSGVSEDEICSDLIRAVIKNNDVRSTDYDELRGKPRPSHADYAAYVKWGNKVDMRGGGCFSGRLTAPLCIAGGIAKQILARRGVFIGAHLSEIGHEKDESFPLFPTAEMFERIASKDFPSINDDCGARMQSVIAKASEEKDSVGGIIECATIGVKAGIGSPMFDGIENRISAAIFGIPAVKGIEFGSGFEGSRSRGSENNDAFSIGESGKITTVTNCSGGILGGISDGMPICFRVAIKPTPSIGREQKTVNLSENKNCTIKIKGRHDPCIAHRAVPVVEAVTALVLLDMILEEENET